MSIARDNQTWLATLKASGGHVEVQAEVGSPIPVEIVVSRASYNKMIQNLW